jgi:hypothetical protein
MVDCCLVFRKKGDWKGGSKCIRCGEDRKGASGKRGMVGKVPSSGGGSSRRNWRFWMSMNARWEGFGLVVGSPTDGQGKDRLGGRGLTGLGVAV